MTILYIYIHTYIYIYTYMIANNVFQQGLQAICCLAVLLSQDRFVDRGGGGDVAQGAASDSDGFQLPAASGVLRTPSAAEGISTPSGRWVGLTKWGRAWVYGDFKAQKL